jgi:hypothetical protein
MRHRAVPAICWSLCLIVGCGSSALSSGKDSGSGGGQAGGSGGEGGAPGSGGGGAQGGKGGGGAGGGSGGAPAADAPVDAITRLDGPVDAGGMDRAPAGLDAAADAPPRPVACMPWPPSQPACAGLCGNGRVDSCDRPCNQPPFPVAIVFPGDGGSFPVPPLCPPPVRESCDGTDVGTASCASLGYAGGPLGCTSFCTLDSSSCDGCKGGDSHVLGCASPALKEPSLPMAMAMATTDNEIAVAWVASGGPRPGLRFTRFAPDLTVRAEGGCFGSFTASTLELAATPTGYVLAVQDPDGVWIYALAPDGTPRGEARLLPRAAQPLLAPRPGGGPLLAWMASETRSEVRAALLSVGGQEETAPVTLLVNPLELSHGSAVYTGDGFLVGGRESASGVVVTKVGLDGAVAGRNVVSHGSTEYPQLAWNGSEARLTYGDFRATPSTYWLRIGRDGKSIGAPVALDTAKTYFNPAPLLAWGEDTIALLASWTGQTGGGGNLLPARVTAAGTFGTAPYPLLKTPGPAQSYRIGRRGPEAVVAWIEKAGSTGRIGLARISP